MKGPALGAALLALCVAALFLSVDGNLLRYVALRCYTITVATLPGVMVALACAGAGDMVARRAVVFTLAERWLLAFACGLGMVSVVVGALGFAGVLTQAAVLGVVAAGLLCGIPLWRETALRFSGKRPAGEAHAWMGGRTYILMAALGGVALLVLGFALTPPLLFDVTEYHLGPYRDYAAQGRLTFFAQPYNFYARFPFAVESLYFLGLHVAPYSDTAPKLLNAASVLACAALAGFMVWRYERKLNMALLAALGVLTFPVMLDVSVDAMIDAPVALMVLVSFYALLQGRGVWPGGAAGASPAAGVVPVALVTFASALSAKYTVAQLYLLPWVIVAGPVVWAGLRGGARPVVLAVVGAALIPLVWFGKNAALYGNPLEPFFQGVFHADNAREIAREAFYIESHFPQSVISAKYWASLLPRLHEFTLLYLVACVGWLLRDRRRLLGQIALFVIPAYGLWNLVGVSQDRFLLPCMVLVVTAAVLGISALPRQVYRVCGAVIIGVFCAMNGFQYMLKARASGVAPYLLEFTPVADAQVKAEEPLTPREQFLELNLGALGRAISKYKRVAGEDSKLLLIYEARPYLFSRPAGYNTVWDDSLLLDIVRECSTTEQALQALRRAGYTHVLINKEELIRYIQQYARPSQLRRLGLPPGQDPRAVWGLTSQPQALYPPFYRDADWQRLAPVVAGLLQHFEDTAVIREGTVTAGEGVLPLDVVVAPVP